MTVRPATPADEEDVHALAADLATSFAVDRDAFRETFHGLLDAEDTVLLVADVDGRAGGYVLGFTHRTFFANGPVAWVEEIAVHPDLRRRGVGRRLMAAFEIRAGTALVALATRRADAFYRALGYQASATYFRKLR